MPRCGFIPNICLQYGALVLSITILKSCQGFNVNQVSIEDNFIDLDDEPTSIRTALVDTADEIKISSKTNKEQSTDVNIDLGLKEDSIDKGRGHILSFGQVNGVTVDDEDFLSSGSGSGSGDIDLDLSGLSKGDKMTTTGLSSVNTDIEGPTHKLHTIQANEGGRSDGEDEDTTKDEDSDKNDNENNDGPSAIPLPIGDIDDKGIRNSSNQKVTQIKSDETEDMNDDKDVRISLLGDVTRNDDNEDNNDKSDENKVTAFDKDVVYENKETNDVYVNITKRKVKGSTVKDVGDDDDDKEDDNSNGWKSDDDYSDAYFDDDYDDDYDDDTKSESDVYDYNTDEFYDTHGKELYDQYDDVDDDDDDDYDDDDDDDEFDDDEDVDASYDITNIQSDDATLEQKWSKWRTVGPSTKVRVMTCKDQKAKEESCDEVKLQVKSCSSMEDGDCGQARDMTSNLSVGCNEGCLVKNDTTLQETPASPDVSANSIPTPAPAASPEGCEYSLYDKKGQKFVFVRWDLSQLVTESKVKRWCRNENDQYIIMSTPTDVCRKFYKDLCQASRNCKSSKPPRERGDFAEGCWRGMVFGDMLPVGLSNRQTIIYFICQRYSSDSAMGREFGYKTTHFGTLYDTKLRAPVLSLHKMMQVGDETWPESDYFIEHGLIEQKKDVMWLFSRHRKGMVTLNDLDRCYNDQPCDLGRYQVMPEDYSRKSGNFHYTPTPLIWPEWMAPSPDAKMATLTMTNTVPLHSSLMQEWQTAIRKVRTFAIDKCGIPYLSDPNSKHPDQLSSHRTNKSALYIASGSMPSPTLTARDIPVPSHLWVAGCCVRKYVDEGMKETNDAYYLDEVVTTSNAKTQISSFSFYIPNEAGSHVTFTSVLRLELLLQGSYKLMASDPEVTLFPGRESSCSDLKNNVAGWFQN